LSSWHSAGVQQRERNSALGDKYLGLAGPVLGAERARATLALLWRLDELDTLAGLCDALAG